MGRRSTAASRIAKRHQRIAKVIEASIPQPTEAEIAAEKKAIKKSIERHQAKR